MIFHVKWHGCHFSKKGGHETRSRMLRVEWRFPILADKCSIVNNMKKNRNVTFCNNAGIDF